MIFGPHPPCDMIRVSQADYINAWNKNALFIDPDTTYVSYTDMEKISFGAACVIHPGVYLIGRVAIGAGAVIGPHCMLTDVQIGEDTLILSSTITDTSVGSQCRIGPYALIENSVSYDNTIIGFSTELRRTSLGPNSVAKHHCYIGDAQVGRDVNIAAGAITGNYDGTRKHSTIIEDGAFIGINVYIIASVTVGLESYIGAGAVITQNVEPHRVIIGVNRILADKKSFRLKTGWQIREDADTPAP